MGWLNTEKPPEKWSQSYFKMFVERVRTAINYLDTTNFPDGISGILITDRSISLNPKVTGYGGMYISQDFFALLNTTPVTATTLTSYGSAILWSPTWNNYANMALEVTCYVANASYPATVELHGTAGAVVSQSITNTALQRIEIPIAEMPSGMETVVFKAKVDNASYALNIMSARLLIKMSESI